MKKNILNKKFKLIPSGKRLKGSPVRRCPDVKKLKNLGFKPKFSLEKGIKSIITNSKF